MRNRRRVVVVVLLTLVGILALAAVASAVTLWRSADDLTQGRHLLLDGKRALLTGSPDDAEEAFAEAHRRFDAAADDLGGPLAASAAALPAIGNTVDVARSATEAGLAMADAGLSLSGALADLPEGLGALAPQDGQLPLERYADVASATEAAAEDAARALAAVRAAPDTWIVGPVVEARWDAEEDLRAATQALEATAALLRDMPAFAGGDGPRRYLVVSENPAELRGTGGLWGAYAVLTFDDGRATIGAAAPTQSLPDVDVDAIDDPNPDYRRTYDQFGGASSWQNLNMTPDFPSAARAALGNWEAGGGMPLDGVIAADPFALEAMLAVTGPVPVPGTELTIGADEVVAFTTNEAYSVFTGPEARKEVLGAVAADVFARFLSMRGRTLPRLRAIGDAAGGGHLKVYSVDPQIQDAFVQAGVTGAFAAEPGDVVGVHVNNGSANKVDVWARREISLVVQLGGEGEAFSTIETTIENAAPTAGYPPYVLGPRVEGLGPGDQSPLITTSCHEPCEPVEARRDGEPVGVAAGRELGIPWYRDYRPIPAGEEGRFALTWRTSGTWEGDPADGTYRLTFLGQTTIDPTDLRITIETPTGTRVVWTNVPMRVDGGTATWRGTPGPAMTFEIRFRAPTGLRWWRSLTG